MELQNIKEMKDEKPEIRKNTGNESSLILKKINVSNFLKCFWPIFQNFLVSVLTAALFTVQRTFHIQKRKQFVSDAFVYASFWGAENIKSQKETKKQFCKLNSNEFF